MKKKKKQSCSCTPKCETECYKPVKKSNTCEPCNENKVKYVKTTHCKPCHENKMEATCCKPCYEKEVECEPISCCKPSPCSKKAISPSYVECPCGDYEITCVDKCVELAKKAEELFDKACKYETDATQTFNQAKECEKSAKLLSQKACNLLKNANKYENQSKEDECKAKELMERAKELCEKAKALAKEAECIEKEAKSNCEKAKCLYEKADTYNEKAKCLYNQALKYDEKALECYKTAGEKIKQYENKSKKCQDMINKCNNKLEVCENNCVQGDYDYQNMNMKPCMEMKPCMKPSMKPMDMPSCGCKKNKCQQVSNYDYIVEKSCNCDDEVIYIDMDNNCSTYVSPIYDMAPMQCMGNFMDKYPMLDNSNMYTCANDYESDDTWMNYYMYMQQMMNQMPYNK